MSSDVTSADHSHAASCNKVHPGWYLVFSTNHCLRWHICNRELIEWSFPYPFLLLAINLKNSLEVDSQLLSCLLLLDLFISLYNIILFAVSNSRGKKNKRKKKHIYCWIKGHLKDFFKLCSILSTFNSPHYVDVCIYLGIINAALFQFHKIYRNACSKYLCDKPVLSKPYLLLSLTHAHAVLLRKLQIRLWKNHDDKQN